jgi:transcription termination factor Rho
MSVLDRSALEASPLADLHAIATELGLDGFRRMRKADLVDAILARGGGEQAPDEEPAADEGADDDADRPARRPRTRGGRGGRGRTRDRGRDAAEPSDDEEAPKPARARARGRDADDEDARPARRGGRGRGRGAGADAGDDEDAGEERVVAGTIELLGNGSGFLRLSPPDPSDEDVYVSAAQVRRCELVSGDVVAGPMRPPRRSERYPSLVRVETINGLPADEVAEGTRYDDLPASFPSERLTLGGEDPTVKAIEFLTPIGKGSRVAIVGAARAGKTETLRRLAGALSGQDGLEVSLVLAGARPEEVSEWSTGPVPPAGVAPLAASGDVLGQVIEQAVEQGKRVAARGGDAVVLIDSLEGVAPTAARRALAAARNIVDGGSLTVIATAPAPLGGETTVIALDPALVAMRRFPSLDLFKSGAIRPELLVGEAGAEAIAQARADALESGSS